MEITARISMCRTCFKVDKVYTHPLDLFSLEECICIDCISIVAKNVEFFDDSNICHICGEINGKLFKCYNTDCCYRYCLGCLSANFGKVGYTKILKKVKKKKWKCLVCDIDSNKYLNTPDIQYRSTLGGFTPRTFIPISRINGTIRQDCLRLLKKPADNAPYKVISVTWFVKDVTFGKTDPITLTKPCHVTTYLLGLARNIKQLDKYFDEWVMRIYYDSSVISAYPQFAPQILKAFTKHPKIELHRFPDWPEFKRNNGLYMGLIPSLFRLFALDDPQIDVVAVRDIDSVLSKNDFDIMQQFLQSSKTMHRYYCKNYMWPLLTGGFAVNNKYTRSRKLSNLTEMIYDFLAEHFKNPKDFKHMVYEREKIFRKKHLLRNLRPEEIGSYFIDQVFLEKIYFPMIDPDKIFTTNICIRGCHRSYETKIEKICKICGVTSMENYLEPTYRPSWLKENKKLDLKNVKMYLWSFYWCRKYLFNQAINWTRPKTPRKFKRPEMQYAEPVNLLKRNDFNFIAGEKLNESKFYMKKDPSVETSSMENTEEYYGSSSDDKSIVLIKDLSDELRVKNKDDQSKKLKKNQKAFANGHSNKSSREEEENLDAENKKYLKDAEKRQTLTRKHLRLKRMEFLKTEDPIVIDLVE